MYHNFMNRLHLPYQWADFALLAFAVVFGWWLSGFDSGLAFGGTARNLIRRTLRCVATFVVVETAHRALLRYGQDDTPKQALIWITTALPLAALWYGCISYVVAHGFTSLMDSDDRRAFDPEKSTRQMEEVASLIREGKKAEAIKRCKSLKVSGDVDIAVVDLMLSQLGVATADNRMPKPLQQANRWRAGGKFREAEAALNGLLKKNPRDVEAAMMLVRLYAQDLRQPDQARAVLRRLSQQPNLPIAPIEFAYRSIEEWTAAAGTEKFRPTAAGESVDELLAQKYFGTAIELLEAKIKEQPQDYAMQLKLAEVHGRHCGNWPRAEKIVQQIATNPGFNPEQVQQAQARLVEWRQKPPVASEPG